MMWGGDHETRSLSLPVLTPGRYRLPVLTRAILNPMTTPPLPEQIEAHRDRMWRRDEDVRIESALDAERFIEDVGFANTLTDTRRAGPSLYIAVCGRRDVSLPRNGVSTGSVSDRVIPGA